MGSTGGWTLLASSLPEFSHSGWTSPLPGGSNDPFWSVYYYMTEFSQVSFTSGDDSQSTPDGLNRKDYDLSMCAGVSMHGIVASGNQCGELDFQFSYTHQGCPLKAHIAYSTHVWDGGVSGAILGWGSNGYKTNNNVNCNSQCVINCNLNSGLPSGSSTSKMWVK